MRWRVKWTPRLLQDVVLALRDARDETFKLSQEYVPVDKGTLKKSGVAEDTETGGIIAYRTSYAAKQEFGLPPGATEEVPKHTVRAHRRRSHTQRRRGRQVVVPAHSVAQHRRGPFVKTYPRGLRGKFYLTRAWNEVRPRLVRFLTNRLSR